MKKRRTVPDHWAATDHCRYEDLEKKSQRSNCRKLSDYGRMLFGKPMISNYRNRSLDDLIAEAMLLRKELNAIGVNFNQAVHRLHTPDHLPQMQQWLAVFEADKNRFQQAG